MPDTPPRNRNMLNTPAAFPTSGPATAFSTAFCAAGMAMAGPHVDEWHNGLQVREPRPGNQADPRHAACLQDKPCHDQPPLSNLIDHLAGDRRDDKERGGPWQQLQPGGQRAAALPELQKLG